MRLPDQQIKVTIGHIRKAGLCMGGTRKWFANYGFPWADFLRDGKSVEELEATRDPLAFQVTAIARQEFQNGRQSRRQQ